MNDRANSGPTVKVRRKNRQPGEMGRKSREEKRFVRGSYGNLTCGRRVSATVTLAEAVGELHCRAPVGKKP